MLSIISIASFSLILGIFSCALLSKLVHPQKNAMELTRDMLKINVSTPIRKPNTQNAIVKSIITTPIKRNEMSKKINEKHGPNVKRN